MSVGNAMSGEGCEREYDHGISRVDPGEMNVEKRTKNN